MSSIESSASSSSDNTVVNIAKGFSEGIAMVFWRAAKAYLAEHPLINTTRQDVVLAYTDAAYEAWLASGKTNADRNNEMEGIIYFKSEPLDALETKVEPVLFNGVMVTPPPVITGIKGYAQFVEKYGGKDCALIASVFTYNALRTFEGHTGPIFLANGADGEDYRNPAGFSVAYKNLLSYTMDDWKREQAQKLALPAPGPNDFTHDGEGKCKGQLPEWPSAWVNACKHSFRVFNYKANYDDWVGADSTEGVFAQEPSGILLQTKEVDAQYNPSVYLNGLPVKRFPSQVYLDGYKEIVHQYGIDCGIITASIVAAVFYQNCGHLGPLMVGASGPGNAYGRMINGRYQQDGSAYAYLWPSPHARVPQAYGSLGNVPDAKAAPQDDDEDDDEMPISRQEFNELRQYAREARQDVLKLQYVMDRRYGQQMNN